MLIGRQRDPGFTLIEVMVALVITLIALDVLFGGIVASLGSARRTAELERAISRAESHLAAIGDLDLTPGERSGDDGEGYRFHTQIVFLTSVPAPAGARTGPWARGTALYDVSVTIGWREGRSERSFKLSSERLGPAPGASS